MSVARYAEPRWRRYFALPPPWLEKHPRLAYIRQATFASPPWAGNHIALRNLKAVADELTELHGVKYVMAHIIPLKHPYVCGLNVPWNIKLVPHKVNAHEGNRWHPDQLELDL